MSSGLGTFQRVEGPLDVLSDQPHSGGQRDFLNTPEEENQHIPEVNTRSPYGRQKRRDIGGFLRTR